MTKGKEEDLYTILLLGDTVVGKSCYLLRITNNYFQEAYLSTMGYDYKIKHVELENRKKIITKIWDTLGQEKFKSLAKSYYKGAQGIILIYDITSTSTFESIDKWIEDIKEKAPEDIQLLLLGNKCDLESERKISKEQGEELAKKYGMTFYETSVKDDINVREAFQALAEKVGEIGLKNQEQLRLNRPKSESTGCCGSKKNKK